jgi:hypothetical protein
MTGITHAQCIPEIVVNGYQNWPTPVIEPIAIDYPETPNAALVYTANPTAHTTCTTTKLSSAVESGQLSTPSQPTNTALAIPLRYANPIDISNGSPVGTSHGGVSGAAGFQVFPYLANGTTAAVASAGNYAASGTTITGFVNALAPPSINPNALANTLTDLGITAATAGTTFLSSLTATQILQVIAAFAWQEGFKPTGC